MLRFLILALGLYFSQTMSVPGWPLGVSIGSNTPKLHIEGFFDLLGSTSSESYYVLSSVLQSYNINTNPDLRFTLYVWPQNVFTFSYTIATAARYIANKCTNPADLWTFYQLMFNSYQQFSNSATYNSSLNQVKAQLATLISQNMPQYNYNDVLSGLSDPTNLDQADYLAAYGRTKGVVSAPLYFGNGILIDAGDELTTKTWISFISQFTNTTAVGI